MIRKFAFFALAMMMGAQVWAFRTDTVNVATANLERPNRVAIIVPDAAATRTDLPTVYLLNGYSGNYKSWTNIRPDLGRYADMYGMVLVMPSGLDSWYWDSPTNPRLQMESFIVEDLVPYVSKNYPVSKDPAQRAITGLSMGGHGGLWLGTRHPYIWRNIGSTSGGVNIELFPERWAMYKQLGKYADNPQLWRDHTVINLVDDMKANGQNIIFDCGADDMFAGVNADLHQRLLDAKVPHDYISRPGNHNSKYWANSILHQLLYFHEKFKEANSKKK